MAAEGVGSRDKVSDELSRFGCWARRVAERLGKDQSRKVTACCRGIKIIFLSLCSFYWLSALQYLTSPYQRILSALLTVSTDNYTSVSTGICQEQLHSPVILSSPYKTKIHVLPKHKHIRNEAVESSASIFFL